MSGSGRLITGLVAGLVACASGPPPPDWQLNAHASLDRAVAAYLTGDNRVAAAEFDRAQTELARTGRIDLLARAALIRCAAQVASLVLMPCTEFDALAADAPAAERAYAQHLTGRLAPSDLALLPAAQRGVATPGLVGQPLDAALRAIADPVSRLVAAAVLLQTGRASPATLATAVDTASAQGWRRPLLAWLGVQAQRAEQAGDADTAARLRRRMAWVQVPGTVP